MATVERKDLYKYYDLIGEDSNWRLSLSSPRISQERRRFQSINSRITTDLPYKILDAGCGDSELLIEIGSKKHTLFGLDISAKRLTKYSKKNLRENGTQAFLAGGALESIPYKDESFDIVICSEVLEHLVDYAKAVKEVRRVLKQGGLFVLAVPNDEKVKYDFCIHCHRLTPVAGHFHSFNKERLSTILKGNYFKTLRVRGIVNGILNGKKLYNLQKRMPFLLWQFFDGVANTFTKPHWLMAEATKDEQVS